MYTNEDTCTYFYIVIILYNKYVIQKGYSVLDIPTVFAFTNFKRTLKSFKYLIKYH